MAGTNGAHNGRDAEWAGAPETPARRTAGSGRPAVAIRGNGPRTLEVTVEAVNERGVKLGGRWLNYSKWAGELTPPQRGQVVGLTLDGSGCVPAVGPAEPTASRQVHEASRETAIIRQMCLKASAEFCAARPDLKTVEVFVLAERMGAWVLREGS